MSDINHAQIVQITATQEALLRFERFTNKDAWDLGCFLVRRSEEMGLSMAISIRKINGHIVFQHCMDGTALNNDNWIRRKFNTVALTEGSSLRAWASSIVKGQDLAAQGLDVKDYALCGGGFPIRLKTGELIAVLIVSSLPHLEDHKFLIQALSQWLSVENVPMI